MLNARELQEEVGGMVKWILMDNIQGGGAIDQHTQTFDPTRHVAAWLGWQQAVKRLEAEAYFTPYAIVDYITQSWTKNLASGHFQTRAVDPVVLSDHIPL